MSDSGNGRSWRWTPRAKTLGTVLLLIGMALAFVLAALYGINHGTPGPIDGCTVDERGYCLPD